MFTKVTKKLKILQQINLCFLRILELCEYWNFDQLEIMKNKFYILFEKIQNIRISEIFEISNFLQIFD